MVALNHAESRVLRGGNSGRKLTRVGVVQSLTKIGSLEAGKGFARRRSGEGGFKERSQQSGYETNMRVIAFVQQGGSARQVIGGAAQEKIGK